jgi:hypothetical protein
VKRTLLISTVVALTWPHQAIAQFGAIETLFARFTDLSLQVGWGGFLGASDVLKAGRRNGGGKFLFSFGAEFAFEIGERTEAVCLKNQSETVNKCINIKEWKDSTTRTCNLEREAKEIRVRYQRSAKDSAARDTSKRRSPIDTVHRRFVDTVYAVMIDTVFDVSEKCTPPKEETTWTYEFALGYSQTSKFRSGLSEFTLDGVVRESPSISIYATRHPWNPFSPYFGIRSGIIKLDELQLVADTTFTASPQSTQIGGVVGVIRDPILGPFSPFGEISMHYRNYPSIAWSTPQRLPTTAPRRLNFSSWSVNVGLSIHVVHPENKKD